MSNDHAQRPPTSYTRYGGTHHGTHYLSDGRGSYIGHGQASGGVAPVNPADYADHPVAFTGGLGTGKYMGPLEGEIRRALREERSYVRFCQPSEIYKSGEDDRARLKEPLAEALAEAVQAGVSVKIERLERTDGAPETVRVVIGGSC